MSSLPTTVLPRVAQLVRLFGSPHDGEALGACRAIGRVLQANGASFADLAERIEREPTPRIVYRERSDPASDFGPSWATSSRLIVRAKLERSLRDDVLTPWERDFAASIVGQIAASRAWRPTPRQEARLHALIAKLKAAGAWE